eukprot:50220_1
MMKPMSCLILLVHILGTVLLGSVNDPVLFLSGVQSGQYKVIISATQMHNQQPNRSNKCTHREDDRANIESASTWSPVPDNKDHDTVLLVSAVVLGVCVFCCCRKHKEDIDNPYQRDQIKHDLPPPAQIAMLVPANTGNVLQGETPGKHTLTWSIPLEENSEHGSEDETANLEEESDSDAQDLRSATYDFV